jgi:iron complex outermembrane receptor protein
MFLRRFKLWLIAITIFSTAPIHAKTDMEHVIVTTAIHKTNAETALPITVINKDELRDQLSSSIGETLGSVPGISNASFGPSVGQPVIRGQQGPRVSVLQNGTNSADASNASADHAVSVEPILAESIEILRGPSTFLYGGGAIGGLVNVIDNRIPDTLPKKLTGAIETRYGSVNDEKTTVIKVEGAISNIAFHLDGVQRDSNDLNIEGYAVNGSAEDELEGSNGFIGNSSANMDSYTLGASYIGEGGFIGIAINKLDNNYGIPLGSHEHHDDHDQHADEGGDDDHDQHADEGGDDDHDQHADEGGDDEGIRLALKQTRIDLRGGLSNPTHAISDIRWTLTHSDYQHQEIEGNGEVGTSFSNKGWEGRFELVHKEINGLLGAVGFQFEDSEFSAMGEEGFIPTTAINRIGIFLVEDFHTDSAIYEIAARIDHDKFDPTGALKSKRYSSLSLSTSVMWEVGENWHLGTALSLAKRAPVTEELFSNSVSRPGDYIIHAATDSIELGNLDLEVEQSKNLDISFSYHRESLDAYLTLYYNNFDDYIFAENTGNLQDETAIYMYQQEDAKFYGLEFDTSIDIGQSLGGNIALQIFGDVVRGKLVNAGNVPRMPPARIGGRINYDAEPFSAYISVLAANDQNRAGNFEQPTNGYTRWDAGINYVFAMSPDTEVGIFLKIKNITDEEIRESVSLLRDQAPAGGRSVEAGIRVHF